MSIQLNAYTLDSTYCEKETILYYRDAGDGLDAARNVGHCKAFAGHVRGKRKILVLTILTTVLDLRKGGSRHSRGLEYSRQHSEPRMVVGRKV